MRWRQFFTPVKTVGPDHAKKLMDGTDLTILDVRQPGEYREGHIPGARLVPMGQLTDRLDEFDPDGSVLVYCAVGGRSRVAAQILAGKGFKRVLNLSGGYKAWSGGSAFGDQDQGLELFPESPSLNDVAAVAVAMEQALQRFYKDRAEAARSDDLRSVFQRLAGFEEAHLRSLRRLVADMGIVADTPAGIEESSREPRRLEGGMSAEEYATRLGLDLNRPEDVVDLAMAIEAQAMDLYSRAGAAAEEQVRDLLDRLAMEERAHLKVLGELMDRLHEQPLKQSLASPQGEGR
jgi:sulfur-carrier protein adenylyltransferase/sulfurtransferase